MKISIFVIGLVLAILLFIPVVSANSYYTIPVQALSNTPADAIWNYFGITLSAPSLSAGQYIGQIPTNGTIERVELYDYSGTAGSAQEYTYYLRINNNTNYLIASLSVSQSERIFSNASMNVPVTIGDTFEIARLHPTWNPNPATNIVGGYIFVNSSSQGYPLPVQALTSTPGDLVWNYYGFLPVAPSTSSAISDVFLPAPGIITKVMINDYSGTAGTNETINVSIMKNGGDAVLVQELSVSQNQRIFENMDLGVGVGRGDFIQIRRGNPNWSTNPATNRPSGLVYVNMSAVTNADPGYPIFVKTITSTIARNTTAYFGNRPIAPSTTAGTNKVYLPMAGNITRVELYQYSGTAGTAEPWSMYIRVNNATDYLISKQENVNKERFFKNLSMSIPVVAGDYIEIKSIQPGFVTQPATAITAGYLWVVTGSIAQDCPETGSPPFADFSSNVTTAVKPATIKFYDQSNNTIPGTTVYFWNFTGGNVSDSSDVNPTFTYTDNGTFTVNHTISSNGNSSTMLKNITISGGSDSAPVAAFNLVLTDNSTQYPTTWIWNVTDLLGNNTEFTYSTAQNPILDLGKGNWRINLTATNSFGSDTASKTIGLDLTSPKVYFWNRTA